MIYYVRIDDTTGFDIIGSEYFDTMEDVAHYLISILPYIDYYKYSATVDTIDKETGEILQTDVYYWCVTNCGGCWAIKNTYMVQN